MSTPKSLVSRLSRLRRITLAGAGMLLGVALTSVPATMASANNPNYAVLYAFANGTGSGPCNTTGADCSLTTALTETPSNGTQTIYLEQVGSTNPYQNTNGFSLNTHGSSITIEPDPAIAGTNAYLDGTGSTDSILTVQGLGTVRLSNLNFQNGDALTGGANGGAIYVTDGTALIVSNSTFSSNYAGNNGGAIDIGDGGASGGLSLTNSTLSGNSANNDGGAIDIADNGGSGYLTITNSTLTNNSTAVGDGGAIDSSDGNHGQGSNSTVTITSSTLDSNTAYNCGGAIDNGDSNTGTLTITGSDLNGNAATTGAGGAINSGDGGSATLTISSSSVNNNSAYDLGGAINSGEGQNGNATATIANSTFDGNNVSGTGSDDAGGGAIASGDYHGTGVLNITGSLFGGNSSSSTPGGAISSGAFGGTSTLNVGASEFVENEGFFGGAISTGFEGQSSSAVITGSTFQGNLSEAGGAISSGLANALSNLSVSLSTFNANVAYLFGGAIFSGYETSGASAVITRSTFAGDTSSDSGNELWNYGSGSTLTVAGSVLANPVAPCAGTITSMGYNLEQDNGGSCDFIATTDQNNVATGLGSLIANGGPVAGDPSGSNLVVQSQLPSTGSPLANVIPVGAAVTIGSTTYALCTNPDIDQRGVAQASNSPCSIGSLDVAPTLPNPPQNLLTSRTATTETATWTAPSGGPAPTGYLCTLMYGYSNPSTFQISTTSTTCTFNGLSPTSQYGVQVQATNGGGTSAPVASFAATAPPVTTTTPPTPPVIVIPHATKVVGTALTGGTVTVTILGSGFYGRPSVQSSVFGVTATVTHDTGTKLTVVVTTAKNVAPGTHQFTIVDANNRSCDVSYVQK